MPQSQIVEDLREKRKKFGLTVRAVQEMTNTAESTTRKVFSGGETQYNFTMETLQPYIDLFSRMEEQAEDLKPEGVSVSAEDRRTIALYERIILDKNMRIDELLRQIETMEAKAAELDRNADSQILHLQSSNKWLLAVSAFLLASVIALFIYDFANPDKGWIMHMFSGDLQSFFRSFARI